RVAETRRSVRLSDVLEPVGHRQQRRESLALILFPSRARWALLGESLLHLWPRDDPAEFADVPATIHGRKRHSPRYRSRPLISSLGRGGCFSSRFEFAHVPSEYPAAHNIPIIFNHYLRPVALLIDENNNLPQCQQINSI